MTTVAVQRALNPQLVLDALREHQGDYPFAELVSALEAKGLDESQSRELIWQVLALGYIEFTADRSALRLRPEFRAGDEGRVA